MRAKCRALMAQLLACCSWSAYGRWAPKKGRAGLPSSTRLVPSITHRSQHLVEPLKPAKRHQAPKREGQGQNPHKASNGLRKRSRIPPVWVVAAFFQCRNGVWLSCVKTSHSAIHAVFAVCNRRLPPLTLCPVYRGYLHRGGCPYFETSVRLRRRPGEPFSEGARVVVAGRTIKALTLSLQPICET